MSATMTIRQFAKRVGLAPSALRYYEKEGLMPSPPRDGGGRRVYSEDMERWARFLTKLRATGMPIREAKTYVAALHRGPDGDQERMTLLAQHRDRLTQDLQTIQDCLEVVERKLEMGCRPREGS